MRYLRLVRVEPKRLPTDFVSQDSWISDKGPHHCPFCGYCVITRTPQGELVPVHFDYRYFKHLPGLMWHPACAESDERIDQALRAQREATAALFS